MAKYKLRITGKKGLFLTFIAITLVATFILIFTPSQLQLMTKENSASTRIENLNEYVEDLENIYLERTLQSTSIKTIKAIILYMESQNTFLQNFEEDFEEVLLTGKINSVDIDSLIGQSMMQGNNYNDWISKINETGNNAFNIDSDFSVLGVSTYQERPWQVIVNANVSFKITSETATWDKEVQIYTEIEIEKFNDPYYLVNTGGLYNNRINRTDVKINEWNKNNVKKHIGYGTYLHIESSEAPNFIMRFTNTSLSSLCCGIESIVDPNKFSGSDKFENYVDYMFFNNTYGSNCNDLFNVTSVWPEYKPVKLNFKYLALYNLTDESFIETC
ncbi:hypothetical protein ISS07_03785 [Candidatus Woesearchaeota archaeon]|nr:hypothetical protein [Candidatus Woesearchaeota archaeon]